MAGCDLVPASSETVRAFRQSVIDAGGRAFYCRADVTSSDDLRGFVDATVAEFGRLDIVVSNAGRNFFHGAAACDETQWQECLDLNLASHWRLAKLCRPHLEATGRGVIVVMASNHAEATIPGCFPYNVAKTALVGLVRSLAAGMGAGDPHSRYCPGIHRHWRERPDLVQAALPTRIARSHARSVCTPFDEWVRLRKSGHGQRSWPAIIAPLPVAKHISLMGDDWRSSKINPRAPPLFWTSPRFVGVLGEIVMISQEQNHGTTEVCAGVQGFNGEVGQ